jgi:hypothetical protein
MTRDSNNNNKSLLRNFPTFELCYEIITHKKVLDANVAIAVPQGTKCFAWFKKNQDNNTVLLIHLDHNKHIKNVTIKQVSCSERLSKQTIFYGTVFIKNDVNYFCIEDLYFYSGKNTRNLNYLSKLNLLKNIFNNYINQTTIENNSIIFGLPLMTENVNSMLENVNTLPYNVESIKYRYFDNKYAKKIVTFPLQVTNPKITNNITTNVKTIQKEAIFNVTADVEPDIYNLFVYKNGKEEYYDVAFIGDYKRSVMMNSLFRNVKENANLDAIEESDDEEDFQDNRDDKHVYLDKIIKMHCEYNSKFKRWVPIRLAKDDDKIVSFDLLNNNSSIKK